MKYLGLTIILSSALFLLLSVHEGLSREEHHKHRRHHRSHDHQKHVRNRRSSSDDGIDKINVKLPRVIRRKFDELSAFPENFTNLYHSIPVEVTHVKDDVFLLAAPYSKTKSNVLSVRLWIEFNSITKQRELQSRRYLADIIPVIGSRDAEVYDDCSTVTVVSKIRFPEDILEMKFDITSVYQSCKDKGDSTHFKFKFRFYSFAEVSDIDLNKEETVMFLLFKEKDQITDIMHLIPNSETFEPLHYEKVMRKVPHLRSLQAKSYRPRRRGVKVCSLRPFTFSFEISGWRNYVLAPKEYRSNQCVGKCAFPLAEHLNSTNYAIMKAVASTLYDNIRNPNCIAQDLAPLTMLVCDEDFKITLLSQKEMIATSCKCA